MSVNAFLKPKYVDFIQELEHQKGNKISLDANIIKVVWEDKDNDNKVTISDLHNDWVVAGTIEEVMQKIKDTLNEKD